MDALEYRPPDTMQILSAWRNYLNATLSERTRDSYFKAVWRFFGRYTLAVEDVTEEHVTEWMADFPDRSASKSLAYYALRNLFQWARRRRWIIFDPTENLASPKIIEREPRAVQEDELARLVYAAACRHPMRGYAICLLYYTGARISEAVGLRWSDISDGNVIVRGKGGRERSVPISDGLLRTLAGLQEFSGDERILPRAKGVIWGWVRDAGLEAGFRAFPHLLRATFATTLSRKKVAPHVVQRLLGHRNIKTTVRYWAVTDEDKRDATDQL